MHRREFCRIAALGVVATPAAARAFPVPSGAIVLDNCDPIFRDQKTYADNLSFFNADGTLRARITGLNGCEMGGNPHRVAVDLARGRVWVSDFVANQLRVFDLNGKQLRAIGARAYAVTVEPTTGNAWVTLAAPSGRSDESVTEVFDAEGRSRGVFEGSGYDIAYDAFGKTVWHLGAQLVKVSLEGKDRVRASISRFASTSLAVDARTGAVWVAKANGDEAGGANELLAFDNAGKRVRAIALGGDWPTRVAVDPRDGGVWVSLSTKILRRYTTDGKLEHEVKVPVLSFDIERATGNLWVATGDEVRKMTPKGQVLHKVPHKGPTTQAWVAAY